MKIISLTLYISFIFLYLPIYGQKLSGKIIDPNGVPLENATLNWLNTKTYAITDEHGIFNISRNQTDKNLIVSFIAFIPDTVVIEMQQTEITIQLKDPKVLKEININTKRLDNYTSTLQTKNLEIISAHELKKAPCCSLSESFETNPTVDVVQTDAVTGTKEIQMLGLKGIYTQTLIENRPDLSGIASSYALDYIQGSWIESIQISKGASTVTSGFNSITGQINVELVKPFNDKSLFVNVFTNHEGRYESNLHVNKKFNSHLSSGILLHASGQQNRDDHDHDGFIDNVLRTTYNGLYRLFYITDKFTTQFNFQIVDDTRKSGQFTHTSEQDKEATYYHILQHNRRYDAFGKFAYLGLKGENESIGFLWHAIRHTINNEINIRPLDADQTDLFASLLYKNAVKGNSSHMINLGITGQMDKSNQSFDKQYFSYNDRLIGAHAEYSYQAKDKHEAGHSFLNNLGLIAGIRLDHHSEAGWIFTPRINLKYNFSYESIIRLSAGRGLRRARPFTDNIYQTANNKSWIIEPNLKLEDAWNYGGNFTHNFTLANRTGQFNIDVYRVIFNNQVVIDPDVDPTKIFVYSLQGTSYS
ncbi:MAG TPA: carboxypeptidase-like regulatory domain-containing protein, partial [Saprospiraceae bacterium]|nr:carboxypeptidase-like regulatory domain-containing protein [Saprospiraceae bacterium]